MSLFRVFVDDTLFYHPNLSQLAITTAQVQEDAESIDSLTLSAPFKHPYIDSIKPMASTIICKKGDTIVFEGRALDDGTDFYNTHTWTCESALAYLKDSIQPPFSYKGSLRGLLEHFLTVHNSSVEEKKRFTLGTVTVEDGKPTNFMVFFRLRVVKTATPFRIQARANSTNNQFRFCASIRNFKNPL